jgi:hypothetical protein
LGILRLLGARRLRLVILMLAHAAAYAVPALVVALCVSQVYCAAIARERRGDDAWCVHAQAIMPLISAALEVFSGAPSSAACALSVLLCCVACVRAL